MEDNTWTPQPTWLEMQPWYDREEIHAAFADTRERQLQIFGATKADYSKEITAAKERQTATMSKYSNFQKIENYKIPETNYEEKLLARTFQTYGSEVSKAGALQGEDFKDPHLAEIWEAVLATLKPNWNYTALLDLKLSAKAQDFLFSVQLEEKEHGGTEFYGNKIKEQAKLKHALALSDLTAKMTLENKASTLQQITHLTALLQAPIDLETEATQEDKVSKFINALQKEADFIPSGSKALNGFIDGFSKGRFYIIAARAGVGKTAVALNLLWGLPKETKAVFYSLEMTEEEILGRLASLSTGLPHSRIKAKADPETSQVLARDFYPYFDGENKKHLEIIQPKRALTMADLRAELTKRKEDGNLDIVFIDQFDKIAASKEMAKASEYERFTKHSIELKQLALELEVPLVLLCQINREGNEDPHLKNLKGSGQLEQDADLVFILHTKGDPSEPKKELSFSIAKNRHGKQGRIFYQFEGDLMKLSEPSGSTWGSPSPADRVAPRYSPAGTAF